MARCCPKRSDTTYRFYRPVRLVSRSSPDRQALTHMARCCPKRLRWAPYRFYRPVSPHTHMGSAVVLNAQIREDISILSFSFSLGLTV
ncbi:hypothetical protein J6590_022828 [Homalodisca vitripennis]|nr:hypothetical protein J6590_022828 [Homalodisca vitripennis]